MAARMGGRPEIEYKGVVHEKSNFGKSILHGVVVSQNPFFGHYALRWWRE